jgi:hypothetical protein
MLRSRSDWRCLLERADTPWWYPTLRLFRHRTRGNWDEVVVRVRRALELERARASCGGDGDARAATRSPAG